jgi:hypothetical protein
VRFGPIDGRTAIIYGMSTNNGIQAFELTIDPAEVVAGDFDGNGMVDGADFAFWEAAFGETLDGTDFLTWQQNFAPAMAANATAASVPEPTSVVLTGLTLIGLATRRRRSVA